jgi:hypothetical protein
LRRIACATSVADRNNGVSWTIASVCIFFSSFQRVTIGS